MAKITKKTREPIPETQSKSMDSYISMALGLAVVFMIGVLAYNFSTRKAPATDTSGTQAPTPEETIGTTPTGSLPASHTVKSGETLWQISQDYYNNGYNWTDIARANKLKNSDILAPGQKLTMPNITPTEAGDITPAAASDTRPKNATYTIRQGDSLWTIAAAQYGTGYKWTDIAAANYLANPNLIHTGNTLKLP